MPVSSDHRHRWARAIDAWASCGLQEPEVPPDALRRLRQMVLALSAIALGGLLYGPVFVVTGRPLVIIAVVLALSGVSLGLLHIRWGTLRRGTSGLDRRLTVGANLGLAGLAGSIALSLLDLGGVSHPSLGWLLVVPVLAGLLLGRTWGVVWGGLALAELVALWGAELLGLHAPMVLPPGLAPHVSLLSVAGALATVVIAIRFVMSEIERESRRSARAIARLDAQVNERRAAEQAARAAADSAHEAEQMAIEALRVRSRFLAMISHEIRTPLNGMLGMSQVLAETDLDEHQLELLSVALSAGDLLLDVVNDVLDFSRLDEGQLVVDPVPTDLAELAADVAALYRSSAEADGLELRVELHTLPAQAKVDPTRLSQILSNLVSNGVKFTQAGHVALRGGVDGDFVWFEVQDTGPGISEAAQEHLFEPFTQADASTTRTFGGTGLGLAISRQLAELMGGSLSVHSQPGRGSTFRLELPYTPCSAPQEATPASVAQLEPQRVLVVDDNPVNRMLASTILRRAGHQITEADDGERALERVNQGFDAVVMDVRMPGMDGLEATRRIRQREKRLGTPRLPILACTADTTAESRAECRASGMDGYVAKPFTAEQLLGELARVIRGERMAAPQTPTRVGISPRTG